LPWNLTAEQLASLRTADPRAELPTP